MEKYKFELGLATKKEPNMKEKDMDLVSAIAEVNIPPGRYFLPFSMCLISAKSFKYEFFKILDSLYCAYVNNNIVRKPETFEQPHQMTFE